MKPIFFAFYLFIASYSLSFSQSSDQRLMELISNNDFFTLKKEYHKLESDAGEFMQLLSTAMLNSYFNKPNEALVAINKLFTGYSQTVGNDVLVALLNLMGENYSEINDYENAFLVYKQLIDYFSDYLDKQTMEELSYTLREVQALKDSPKFDFDITKTYTISYKRDVFNNITIPVISNSFGTDFVLDFGASENLTNEKYAELLNIEYIQDSLYTSELNGARLPAKLGIAKKLQIGDMELFNVPFYIISEDFLKNLSKEQEMKGLIGLSTLKHFKNMILDREKSELTVNPKIETSPESNIMFFNNSIYIQGVYEKDTLLMRFDTGAQQTILLGNYYQKYNSTDWVKDSIEFGGVSNIETFEIFTQKDFKIKVGTQEFELEKVKIVKEKLLEIDDSFDGYLGIDLFDKSKGMIINFENMYISYF